MNIFHRKGFINAAVDRGYTVGEAEVIYKHATIDKELPNYRDKYNTDLDAPEQAKIRNYLVDKYYSDDAPDLYLDKSKASTRSGATAGAVAGSAIGLGVGALTHQPLLGLSAGGLTGSLIGGFHGYSVSKRDKELNNKSLTNLRDRIFKRKFNELSDYKYDSLNKLDVDNDEYFTKYKPIENSVFEDKDYQKDCEMLHRLKKLLA